MTPRLMVSCMSKKVDSIIFGYGAFDHAVTTLKQYIKVTPGMDVHKLFNEELDVDQDGCMSLMELQMFFQRHPKLQMTDLEAQALMYHIDPNRDSTVSLKEFMHAFNNHKKLVGKISKNWERHQALKRKSASACWPYSAPRAQARRDLYFWRRHAA